MGRLSASIISTILIMAVLNLATLAATDATPTSLAPTPLYDVTTMSFDSAAFNWTLINASEKVITHSGSCLAILYPITTYAMISSPRLMFKRAIQCTTTVSQYPTITESGTVAYATPSPYYTSDDIQRTATVTPFIESSRGACKSNTKQANIAAGVVGGFVGGSVFGIVLTVLVTAVAAMLIIKRHKNRYVYQYYNIIRRMCVAHDQSRNVEVYGIGSMKSLQ